MTDEMNEDIETEENEPVELPDEETRPLPYAKDSEYLDLLKYYQNADWEDALNVLKSLLAKYPEDAALLEFQHEIQMRFNMQQVGQIYDRAEKQQQFARIGLRVLIALAVAAVLIFAVNFGIDFIQARVEADQVARTQAAQAQSLAAKFANAEKFMRADRVTEALTLLEEIQAEDPAYEGVAEMIEQAQAREALAELYQQGRAEYETGDLDSAKETLKSVLEVDPRYKDAASLVNRIENIQSIDALRVQASQAYQDGDWLGVVTAFEEIKEIDNSTDTTDLEEELFISYMNLVIETAEGGEATVEDVGQAEQYYRAALAIFPQNKEFEKERADLQRIAINLLANKFYIYAVDLIEQEDYSIDSMREALKLLTRASNIGSGSPAIASEISQLTDFLTAFDNYTARRWESAIDGFEQLYRISPDYANGMLKYLLYETYLARGDTFYSFAEYENAREDYNMAETFAWGDEGNKLRLFQIEIRIGSTLRRLTLAGEASEYYSYALTLVNFPEKLGAGQQELSETWQEAEGSLASGDFWNAARLYEILLEDVEMVYQFETISIRRGDSLAHLAFRYGSSVDAILLYNDNLGDSLIVRSDQEIRIPTLVEDQN